MYMYVCINSKVSLQVIPAALEAIKDAEYEGTYIRPVSIQYFFKFKPILQKFILVCLPSSGDAKSKTKIQISKLWQSYNATTLIVIHLAYKHSPCVQPTIKLLFKVPL